MLKLSKILLLVVFCALASSSSFVGQAAPLTRTELDMDAVAPAVVQAVEDEIYDLGEEGKYFLVDNQGAGDSKPATISIHISTEISGDGHGVAVYKLMPYGEVYRYFTIHDDGLAVLSDDPHNGFKPTGGSTLTAYMSDDAVCDFIVHRSSKFSFVVDPKVSKRRLDEAIQRQLRRTGYSYRQHFHRQGNKK